MKEYFKAIFRAIKRLLLAIIGRAVDKISHEDQTESHTNIVYMCDNSVHGGENHGKRQ